MNVDIDVSDKGCAALKALSLEHFELIIASALPNAEAVAYALFQIHQRKLYKKRYRSFEAYLKIRWHLSRTRGYQLIHFAKLKSLSTVVDAPKNERQSPPCREVAGARRRKTHFLSIWEVH